MAYVFEDCVDRKVVNADRSPHWAKKVMGVHPGHDHVDTLPGGRLIAGAGLDNSERPRLELLYYLQPKIPEAGCSMLPHVVSALEFAICCRGIAAVTYPWKALVIRPGCRVTDSRRPIILTSRHSNHSGTSTFFQRESPLLLTTSHKPPNPRHFRPNGDDSYGPRLGDLPPFRNSDYFLVSTPVDVDDLVFWKRKTRTMANVRHVGNTSSPSTVIVQYVASRASVLRPNLAAAAEAEDRLHAPSDSGCPFPSLTSFYNHGFGAFHAVLFDLGAQ
ncbi:uncharacterized protein LACBIDRAFT_329102 [Laccaria bicolor S238N-H82]|uniref:Predicted protein n=1 Tax=Laccaria bicolor (strain S238N-H82 / ATCC MYA-4686) TaxID=486041 RepID=B0DH34_LACBS|nr:uncharacterized protein LACBIDRAFT_329102 [Laccaria bicolor S238N-H82]EDR05943.1 predicted protein [Laccaria bicolor S238N-H82]|eukprot:XP_001883231.1 predicted protein [Laccaria bicolor S238N-H82]